MCDLVLYAADSPFPMYPNSGSWRWFDNDYDRVIESSDTFTVRYLPPGGFDPTNDEMIFKLENEVNTKAKAPYPDEFTIRAKRRTN